MSISFSILFYAVMMFGYNRKTVYDTEKWQVDFPSLHESIMCGAIGL
ncbi:hypothetical protein B4144_3057 [Bacillus atrophaeus]|nr:hypothetical protein B4144_3057 [Bacillus atrophaeus]